MYITIESQALIHLIFSLEESQKPHRKPKVRLMTKYQEDEFTVRDGKITLYRRADSPSKVYQARFMANGKCIRRSTNESNRNEAASAAGDIYDEIRFKIRNNLPIGKKTFKTIWEEWRGAVSLSQHRRDYIAVTGRLYILPFFGSEPITATTTARVSEYWPWREANSAKGVPSPQTLKMDGQLLRQFLKWAVSRNYLGKIPEVKSPKKVDRKATRRPVFTKDDIEHFLNFSPYWIGTARNAHHKKRRGLCFAYSSLILFSGLRPKEARLLQWKDVELGETVLLTVHDDTKTGARIVVALPDARDVLEHIRNLNGGEVSDDDYLFPRPGTSDEPVGNFEETFKGLLTYLGLINSDTPDRTIYSLRHTYATFRLLYGKVDVLKLGLNMGTSVEQIQDHYAHLLNPNMADDLNQNDQSGFTNTWAVSLEGFS